MNSSLKHRPSSLFGDATASVLLQACVGTKGSLRDVPELWILADRLEDLGHPQCREALQWARAKPLRPSHKPHWSVQRGRWAWWVTANTRDSTLEDADTLPCCVHLLSGPRFRGFPNPRVAWSWLLEQWGHWSELKEEATGPVALVEGLSWWPATS